ncbi:RnfABCDGE type electron transport complex subunit D [Candidatus Bathyarchaeota archaeon]|nr:RnfABCDGE type electron transport complex subunit D [Candidatus Bathyarchaeota archaeon]
MTKDKLMTYTFIALLILVGVSALSWWPTSIIISAIAVLIAVGIDFLLYKVAVDSPLNTMSAAVFGLIVALSYSLGQPQMRTAEVLPLQAPDAYLYVAFITMIGMVLFKKLQGLKGRKYVNPAAAAKLVVMVPFLGTLLLAKDHLPSGMLGVPALAGPIGYDIIGGNGLAPFSIYVVGCFMNPAIPVPAVPTSSDVFSLLMLQKYHGWVGGASSLAVIIVGIGLFIACRKYIKWRITAAYLATVTLMALLLNFVYPGGDALLRIGFELFIGSSIFLAFFMATDPATTPLTYVGQGIFGVGLGVLTVLIQTYMNFFGGAILALIIMNLTTPILDKIGHPKPSETKITRERPKAKEFETAKVTNCIRCGICLVSCRKNLAPILIKEAVDKGNWVKVKDLNVEYCIACPPNCQLCVDICPTNALVMSGEGEITVSPELCIYCKACQNICPRGEIHVTIDRILHLPITSATWITVLERFASYPAATKELAAKSMKKLRQTVENRADNATLEHGGS